MVFCTAELKVTIVMKTTRSSAVVVVRAGVQWRSAANTSYPRAAAGRDAGFAPQRPPCAPPVIQEGWPLSAGEHYPPPPGVSGWPPPGVAPSRPHAESPAASPLHPAATRAAGRAARLGCAAPGARSAASARPTQCPGLREHSVFCVDLRPPFLLLWPTGCS